MKKSLLFDILLLTTVGALLFGVGLSIFIIPKPNFSETENKYLASFPSFSFGALKDGSFSRQLSLFCSDRIPARQRLISLSASAELLLGKNENNGIIFGKDGYLIPKGEYRDPSTAEKNLAFIDGIKEKSDALGIPFLCALAPRSIDVMSASLPTLYGGDREKIWSFALCDRPWIVDLRAPLSKDGVWYRTDHHWTTKGAFLAYTEISKNLGTIPYAEEHFKIHTVCSDFFGTSHSRVGGIWGRADSIELYRYSGDEDFTLSIPQSKIVKKGFYSFDALAFKDKYSVFLGGNYGLMTITKDGAKKRERLLLIKDSYANSVIPFLALHYDLTVIDPRYYTGNITELLQNADSVLLLFGIDTIATTALNAY